MSTLLLIISAVIRRNRNRFLRKTSTFIFATKTEDISFVVYFKKTTKSPNELQKGEESLGIQQASVLVRRTPKQSQ